MRTRTILQVAVLASSLAYVVLSFLLMSKALDQGTWKGVEDMSFMGAYSGTQKLETAGAAVAVLGLLLTLYGLLLKSARVTRPLRAMIIATFLMAPVIYWVQSSIPGVIADKMVRAYPERAQLAIDTYYWQRLLALDDVVTIEGFPEVTGRSRLSAEISSFRTNLFFLVDIRHLDIRPHYTSGKLPYAYLFHYRYKGELAPGETYANTSLERRRRIEQALPTYIKSEDDMARITQVIALPYMVLSILVVGLINGFMVVAGVVGGVTGITIPKWVGFAAASVLVLMPLGVSHPVTVSPGYQKMASQGELMLPRAFTSWALRYETLVISTYLAIEDALNTQLRKD